MEGDFDEARPGVSTNGGDIDAIGVGDDAPGSGGVKRGRGRPRGSRNGGGARASGGADGGGAGGAGGGSSNRIAVGGIDGNRSAANSGDFTAGRPSASAGRKRSGRQARSTPVDFVDDLKIFCEESKDFALAIGYPEIEIKFKELSKLIKYGNLVSKNFLPELQISERTSKYFSLLALIVVLGYMLGIRFLTLKARDFKPALMEKKQENDFLEFNATQHAPQQDFSGFEL